MKSTVKEAIGQVFFWMVVAAVAAFFAYYAACLWVPAFMALTCAGIETVTMLIAIHQPDVIDTYTGSLDSNRQDPGGHQRVRQ